MEKQMFNTILDINCLNNGYQRRKLKEPNEFQLEDDFLNIWFIPRPAL